MLQTMLHGDLIILLRTVALNWMCAEKGPAEKPAQPFCVLIRSDAGRIAF